MPPSPVSPEQQWGCSAAAWAQSLAPGAQGPAPIGRCGAPGGWGASGTDPRAGREQGIHLGQLLFTEQVSSGEEAPRTAAVMGRRGWGASHPRGAWPRGTPVPLECLRTFIKRKSRSILDIFPFARHVLARLFLSEGAGSISGLFPVGFEQF